MAKKFTLPEKPCDLGPKFWIAGKGDGDERDARAHYALAGLMLSSKEVDKLLGEGAHDRLFKKGKTGAIEPFFEDMSEFKFDHRYLESTVTLELDGESLTMPASKIINIVLQPQVGGMTWMGCDIETPAELVDGVNDIGRYTGKKIRAQLAFGQKAGQDKRQKELPMDHNADADDDDAGESSKKGNGGRVGAH